jgi:hypothetical protein
MANTTTTNLPSVTSLNGSEEVAVVQGGISARTTTQAIADLNANGGTVTSITADAPLSGGTITTTGTIGLNNDGVTNTYLAPMAAFTIKGNNTSGSTNPQDLTASQARSAMGAAPLASPAFTGTPTAPTPTSLDNSTKIATTAFVKAQSYGTGSVTSVATGAGLTGGPITTTGTIALTTTGVTASTYGSTTVLPQITVDSYGRITSASNITITPSNIGAASNTITISAGTGLSGGGDLTANRTISLASISGGYVVGNSSTGPAAPSGVSLSSVMDVAFGNTVGSFFYRGVSGWTQLTPGTAGQLLTTNGAGVAPSWTTITGAGTVTAVNTGTGLTGGPITVSGTVSIANTGVTAATYGGAATVPQIIVNAQGQITSATDVSISIAASQISSGTIASARISGSYTGITGVGTLTAGTWNASTIAASYGGTGQSTYTIGDLLYASTASALSKLNAGTANYALISNGAGAAPSYQQISLTAGVTGTLPVTNGGTGQSTALTQYGVVYGSTTSAMATTAAGTTGQILVATTGGAPTWSSSIPSGAGVTSFSAGTTGLTPSSATTGAVTLAGTLGVGNGGTGLTSYTTGDLLYASGAATIAKLADVATGSVLVSGGVGVAPSYSATPTLTSLTAATIIGGTAASSALTLQSTSGVGTSDAISFKVGNNGATTAMTINTSGNVGIGTASPATLLHVSGSSTTAIGRIANTGAGATSFDGSGAGLELLAGGMNTTSKYTPAIKFGSTDPDFTTTNPKFGASIIASAAQTQSSDTTGGMNLEFWTAPINPGTGSGLVERMRIDSSGNVGIGTAAPAAILDVYQSSIGTYLRAGTSSTGRQLLFTSSTTTNAGDTHTINASSASGIIAFATNSTEAMRIRTDGGVSIGGTGNPAVTLQLTKNITGSTTAYGIYSTGTVQSDVTSSAFNIQSIANIASGATPTNYTHFRATEGTISGSMTNQFGFDVVNDLISATTNYGFRAQDTAAVGAGKTSYGFYSAINTATGGGTTYGFYANGTANNVMPNLSGGIAASSTLTLQSTTGAGTTDAIIFKTASQSERMRINTSGNLLIGSSTSYDTVASSTAITPRIQVHGISLNTSSLGQYGWNANPYYTFNKSGGAIGTYTAVASGDALGQIQFNGTDGTSFVKSSLIRSSADATPSTGIVQGRLQFYTADSTGALIECMRIASTGQVNIGTQNASNVNDIFQIGDSNTNIGIITSTTINGIGLRYDAPTTATGTQRGLMVAFNGGDSASAYTTSSVTGITALTYAKGTNQTVTNAYGIYVDNVTAASSNNYGIYISTPSGATNNYAIYSNGGINFFNGSVGVGTTSPTAELHIAAGAAAANSAPLKFTSGTNLTTPEAGVVEYDGTIMTATTNTNFKRGTIPITNYTSGVGTSLTATSETTLQVLLPSANDTITLSVGTYFIDLSCTFTRGTVSTTSSQARINLLGTGNAVGTFSGMSLSSPTEGGATANFSFNAVNISTSNIVTAASTTASGVYTITLRGILKITTQGTIIPQYNLSANLTSAGTATTPRVLYFNLQQLDTQSAAAFGPAGTGWG